MSVCQSVCRHECLPVSGVSAASGPHCFIPGRCSLRRWLSPPGCTLQSLQMRTSCLGSAEVFEPKLKDLCVFFVSAIPMLDSCLPDVQGATTHRRIFLGSPGVEQRQLCPQDHRLESAPEPHLGSNFTTFDLTILPFHHVDQVDTAHEYQEPSELHRVCPVPLLCLTVTPVLWDAHCPQIPSSDNTEEERR